MKLLNYLKPKPKLHELAQILTYIVLKSADSFSGGKAEKEELVHFYVYQIDRMVFSINERRRDEIFDAFSPKVYSELIKAHSKLSLDEKKIVLDGLLNDHVTRTTVYSNCNSIMGEKGGFPGKGSAIFALGYFLKRASGKTEIPLNNRVHVLSGNREVDTKNNEAFLDSAELITLSIEIMNTIIEVKKLLNGFRI